MLSDESDLPLWNLFGSRSEQPDHDSLSTMQCWYMEQRKLYIMFIVCSWHVFDHLSRNVKCCVPFLQHRIMVLDVWSPFMHGMCFGDILIGEWCSQFSLLHLVWRRDLVDCWLLFLLELCCWHLQRSDECVKLQYM